MVPRRWWYRAALAASRMQGRLTEMRGGNRTLTEAVMLDNWLWELTKIGPFPIPWTVEGTELIERDPQVGTMFCWVHEPLAEFPPRPYMELGFGEPVVVAHPGRIVGNSEMLVAGMERRLVAIPSNGYALGRAMRTLKQGTSMMCLVNDQLCSEISPLIFRLVQKLGGRLVFQQAKRQPDGTIHVRFMKAPRPMCESDEAIEENVAYLQEIQRQVLAELGAGTVVIQETARLAKSRA